jgi:excisionase family DNA binding protein
MGRGGRFSEAVLDGDRDEVPRGSASSASSYPRTFVYSGFDGCDRRRPGKWQMKSERENAAVLSTEEAAQLLGMPHEFFVDLLKNGNIRYHLVGTDARVTFIDVMAYRDRRDERRHEALNQMAKDAREAGQYDEF